ncbi:MAG TPA: hypothetical protein VFD94_02790 [Jatrophihabitans sp.]|jgi:hypothetical protein|nr:hypothetical protein [Jatrophihabitans sp.]
MDGAALLSLRFNPGPELEQAARECEASVFLRAYGNTREQLQDEYGPYDDSSVFIALSEPGGDVLGCARLIRPGPAGLKTLHDVSRPPWSLDVQRSVRAARLDLTNTWDIATIGARRGLKGPARLASIALFHGVVQAMRANQVASAVMIIDERVRRLLSAVGMFGRALPGTAPASYLGSSASTPVFEHCAQAFDRQRVENPEAYRLYVQGLGLDGISVGELASFRLPQPAALELELAGSE